MKLQIPFHGCLQAQHSGDNGDTGSETANHHSLALQPGQRFHVQLGTRSKVRKETK